MKLRTVPSTYVTSYVNRLAMIWLAIVIFDFVMWGELTDMFSLLIVTFFNDFVWWRQYDKL